MTRQRAPHWRGVPPTEGESPRQRGNPLGGGSGNPLGGGYKNGGYANPLIGGCVNPPGSTPQQGGNCGGRSPGRRYPPTGGLSQEGCRRLKQTPANRGCPPRWGSPPLLGFRSSAAAGPIVRNALLGSCPQRKPLQGACPYVDTPSPIAGA